MTIPADIATFLSAHGRAYLYVLSMAPTRDDSVRGWPMIARYVGKGADGRLVMTSYRKAPKMAHLRAASRATVVVTSDEGARPFRYAVIDGPLKLTDITADMAEEVTAMMHSPGLSGPTVADSSTSGHFSARLAEGKRTLIEVEVHTASLHTREAK